MNEKCVLEENKICLIVRRRYEAEDAPGMDAEDCFQKYMEMRQYLLDG